MTKNQCEGSGEFLMLTWQPDEGYRGGVICLTCSLGLEVEPGTVEPAISRSGFKGLGGMVPAHDRLPRGKW